METPRDITYCANVACKRDCERNLSRHTFRSCVYSVSMFGPDKSGECPCYMKERKANNE